MLFSLLWNTRRRFAFRYLRSPISVNISQMARRVPPGESYESSAAVLQHRAAARATGIGDET